MLNGKKLRIAKSKINTNQEFNLDEGISLLKDITSYIKFDQSLDVAIKLGIDPKNSEQNVRGIAHMPSGLGKSVKILVICNEEKEKEAKDLGADIVGSTNVIEDIKAGKINFDICIATPDVMPLIGQVAKILGPKGLMPNPKLGTLTTNIASAIKNAKSGQVEFRIDKGGIIHAGIGKLSFNIDALKNNFLALISAINQAKPKGVKEPFLKKIFLTSTMGPGIKININETK